MSLSPTSFVSAFISIVTGTAHKPGKRPDSPRLTGNHERGYDNPARLPLRRLRGGIPAMAQPKDGSQVRLRGKPFDILIYLLERPGNLVTRDEFRRHLWGADTFVDFDHGLNAAMNRLRDALGDSAENPRFIQTIPRRGYRFIAPVQRLVAPLPPLSTDEASAPASPGAGPSPVASALATATPATRAGACERGPPSARRSCWPPPPL